MKSVLNTNLLRLALAGIALISLSVSAQEDSATGDDLPIIPIDEYDRGTPRRSGEGFLRALDQGDFETAAEYLDLRNLRGEARQLTGAQLARRLNVIIGRAVWADIDELIDDPDGRRNDNLPSYRDSIGIVIEGDKEIRMLMQKVPGANGASIWKVSNATVSLIPELYATFGYPEFIESLRRNLPQVSFLGYELFKWIIVFAAAVLAYGLVFLFASIVQWRHNDPDKPLHKSLIRFLKLPFGIWVVIISMNTTAGVLGRSVSAEELQRISPLPVIITTWVIFALIDLIRDIYSARLKAKGRPGAVVLVQPAVNAVQVLVAIGAILFYLDQLGINITTVLAGLGVGGVAVALALQKPMEDVFAAIALYAQQPVRVGDFCRIAHVTGTVEEIGLRTTRIRTLANTLIAIPNSTLVNEAIENISARAKILYRPKLRLRYDTTPKQLQQILTGMRELLSSHERVLQDNHRVRFTDFSEDALMIEIFAHIGTTDWAEYRELAEELNIQMLEIITDAGTHLALPTRTMHVEKNE